MCMCAYVIPKWCWWNNKNQFNKTIVFVCTNNKRWCTFSIIAKNVNDHNCDRPTTVPNTGITTWGKITLNLTSAQKRCFNCRSFSPSFFTVNYFPLMYHFYEVQIAKFKVWTALGTMHANWSEYLVSGLKLSERLINTPHVPPIILP